MVLTLFHPVPSELQKHALHVNRLWQTSPDTSTVLRTQKANGIARRRNAVSDSVVFQLLHFGVTLDFWRRAAKQSKSCWPVAEFPAEILPCGRRTSRNWCLPSLVGGVRSWSMRWSCCLTAGSHLGRLWSSWPARVPMDAPPVAALLVPSCRDWLSIAICPVSSSNLAAR